MNDEGEVTSLKIHKCKRYKCSQTCARVRLSGVFAVYGFLKSMLKNKIDEK